ncbi:hypothetical protein WME99_30305 [Sorangium sp. So ce136]|uniref:hypothetical protein n=1 Tax=Sorangium sp. So ce136 TaxID=3133284 RepID=UPI003F07A3D8
MTTMRPEIDFKHVLSELSVNRRYPCEVIRELVSNSYDAKARRIEIYPIAQKRGFIFFDDGIGLSSEIDASKNIAPYVAFFSIGRTTKTKGIGLGYKCQGSKLCFASNRFALITRCPGEADFRFRLLENPRATLDIQLDITPEHISEPHKKLEQLLDLPDAQTKAVLDHLSQSYFASFAHGTMIVVLGYNVEDFDAYFTVKESQPESSYLYNYVRSFTKHGDMRILRPKETGFSTDAQNAFRQSAGYDDKCKLSVWAGKSPYDVPAGYFWLPKPDGSAPIKDPHEITRLRDGTFWDRHAMMFEYGGRQYCLALAVDGNDRAHKLYEYLDRRGKTISGVRLTDQRGAFVSCSGVKVSPYNELFSHGKLEERYGILATGEAQSHYTLIVDGSFDLVTNRNDLAEDAFKLLRSDAFVDRIKLFLDSAYQKKSTFQRLVDRLRKEAVDVKREAQTLQAEDLKDGISARTRLRVLNVPVLQEKWFVAPLPGEEHWVGALYSLFSHLVASDDPNAALWPRAITFSGRGVDSLAVSSKESLKKDDLLAIEYKYEFDGQGTFNHPLTITDYIICWKMVLPKTGQFVSDDYDCYGKVKLTNELGDLGFEITDVTSRSGMSFGRKVVVLSLERLLKKTFKVDEHVPPPPSIAPKKSSKSKGNR